MARRRQFGSVRRLPSGRWQARYEVEGGRSVTAPRTFQSKAEASRWLSSIEADQARGLWVDPDAGKVLLGAYAWSWLRGQVRIARRTREIYETQLRLHVLPQIDPGVPALGGVALADLTPELVRSWYAALVHHRSTSVAAKAYTRLRQVLTRAVDDERITKNPCRIDQGGVEHHPEQRFATMPELYELAAAVPGRYRALVLAAGLSGLREGELFALRWSDVDMAGAAIAVRRKRLRLASGEVIEDDPKSRAGRRSVAIPAVLVPSSSSTEPPSPGRRSRTPTSSRHRRERRWSAATSATGSGSRPLRPSGWQSCASTTSDTPPARWRRAPAPRRRN